MIIVFVLCVCVCVCLCGHKGRDKADGVSMWRKYKLEADGIICVIKERFVPNLFDLAYKTDQNN